jgi:hypothetical protein
MIVDFIQIKRRLDLGARNFIRNEIKKRTPFLNQIGVIPQHEGSDASFETVDKEVNEIEYKPIAGEAVSLTAEEMATISLSEVEQLLIKMAEDFAHKAQQFAFQRFGEILEEAGQTLTENKPIDNESVLRLMDSVDIDFDDTRDRPHMPTIVLHPNTLQRLQDEKQRMSEEQVRAFELKQQEILNRKYEEYVLRENNRKLVD